MIMMCGIATLSVKAEIDWYHPVYPVIIMDSPNGLFMLDAPGGTIRLEAR